MNEIIKMLTSPAWWFSTIFVSLILSIAGAYAKPTIDKFVSKYNEAWKAKTQNEKRDFDIAVKKLIASPQALAQASEQEVRLRFHTVSAMLIFLVEVLYILVGIVLNIQSLWFGKLFLFSFLGVMIFTGLFILNRHREAALMSYKVQSARRILVDLN